MADTTVTLDNNTLIGGSGRDRFILANNSGSDTINGIAFLPI